MELKVRFNLKLIFIVAAALVLGWAVFPRIAKARRVRHIKTQRIETRAFDAIKLKQFFACGSSLPKENEMWESLSILDPTPIIFFAPDLKTLNSGPEHEFYLFTSSESFHVKADSSYLHTLPYGQTILRVRVLSKDPARAGNGYFVNMTVSVRPIKDPLGREVLKMGRPGMLEMPPVMLAAAGQSYKAIQGEFLSGEDVDKYLRATFINGLKKEHLKVTGISTVLEKTEGSMTKSYNVLTNVSDGALINMLNLNFRSDYIRWLQPCKVLEDAEISRVARLMIEDLGF